jgi:hypothetical protein
MVSYFMSMWKAFSGRGGKAAGAEILTLTYIWYRG